MGKTVISRRGARDTKRQNPDVDKETVRALRTVKEQEAFYFYEDIGKPTGELANNLSDFANKIKVVKSESLAFHLQRGDFQNWVENTLGDSKLGKRLAKISPSDDEGTRLNICKTVEDRIEELKESCLTISVEDAQTVVPIKV
jgi:hypothetical protein